MRLELKPIIGERELLVRRKGALVLDKENPVESVLGFEIVEKDVLSSGMFYDILGSIDEDKLETVGEKALECSSCEMKKRGLRPYLDLDKSKIMCVGLMASNRVPDDEISCLNLLEGDESFIIKIEEK